MNAVAEFDADAPSFQLPPMIEEIRDMTRRIVRDELMPLEQQYLASDWATYGATMENLKGVFDQKTVDRLVSIS